MAFSSIVRLIRQAASSPLPTDDKDNDDDDDEHKDDDGDENSLENPEKLLCVFEKSRTDECELCLRYETSEKCRECDEKLRSCYSDDELID